MSAVRRLSLLGDSVIRGFKLIINTYLQRCGLVYMLHNFSKLFPDWFFWFEYLDAR